MDHTKVRAYIALMDALGGLYAGEYTEAEEASILDAQRTLWAQMTPEERVAVNQTLLRPPRHHEAS